MSKLCRLVPLSAVTVLLMLSGRASAGTAVLLRDIAHDPQANIGSAPRQLTPFEDQVAFVAAPPNGPAGVWMSDGTGPGTRLIHAGCPVRDCDENRGPEIFGAVGGSLVFAVPIENQRFRLRLWRTDGTLGGTEPLTPGDPTVYVESNPVGAARVVATEEALYFHACPDAARCGIWQSDGTPAGTGFLGSSSRGWPVRAGDRLYAGTPDQRLLAYDTKTGAGTVVDGWEGFPSFLTAAGGRLFFLASSTDRGAEIWTTDGTAAGTRPLTRFALSNPFAEIPWIKEVDGRAYFVADDGAHGFELWRSDGTVQGTRRVTDFGFPNALRELGPESLAAAGGKILFNARNGAAAPQRLWISDGRPASTAPFRSLCRAGNCNLPTTGSPLVQIGGKVFFPAENGLWSTDGTLPGTRRFRDHKCTGCLGQSVFQALQGRIVFLDKDARGIDLWSSNGTAAGTRRLTDMPEGNPVVGASGTLVAAGGRTWFLGRDRHGEETWVADGEGTRLLADIGSSAPGSEVFSLAPLAGRAVFRACDGTRRAFWTSAGTPETTQPLPATETACLGSDSNPRLLTAAGRLFYQVRDASFIDQVWSTDGGSPVQLTHLTSQTDFAYLPGAAVINDRLLLPVYKADGIALWTSDGTPEGTVPAVELPDELTAIDLLRAAGNEAYFTSASGNGYALWRTDGTPAGTRKVAADVSLYSAVVRLGSPVLFMAYSTFPNGSFGAFGLWKTDGTAAGTVQVKVLAEGFAPLPQEIVALQGHLYFFLPDGSFWNLWRSDGTTAGTVMVRELAEPVLDEEPLFGLTVFAGRLFFASNDGVHGRELWTSDGTAAGTRMVADLFPGIDPSRPQGLVAAGDTLYFSANDGIHGAELWQSDGTTAGTRLAQDIAPQGPSSPRNLTVAGDHLYFTADDGLTGREVWSLPLDASAGSDCRPSSTRLCLNGGRYQVEASWLTPQGQRTGTAVPLTASTGYFSFSDANVDVVVEVLNGVGSNGHTWVFYGALSDAEYTITVTDTQTGLTRRYFNPQGQLAAVGDPYAFGPLGASAVNPHPPVTTAPAAAFLPLVSEQIDKAATAPCQASSRRLCLRSDRFAVEVAWKDFQNRTGRGTAAPLTGDTGTFWFFDAAKIDLAVKVFDGRQVNGKLWLLYGALSNVEYTVTVTDTQTGRVRTYRNPRGRFASVRDKGAF